MAGAIRQPIATYLLMAGLIGPTHAASAAAQSTPVAPATIEMDGKQMLGLGQRLESVPDLPRATSIYRALLVDRDPAVRSEARFRLSRMAIARKDWTAAALLLRELVDDQPDAAAARVVLAQVLVEIGDETGARRQLRAAQAGGLPRDAARMVDRFSEALRVRKPFGASLEIALAPDSNINRATSSGTLGTVIGDFDIDPESKATSGTGVALRGQVFARHSLGVVPVLARVTSQADLYGKSRFNRVMLDGAVGPEISIGSSRLTAEVGARRQWLGGSPYEDAIRVGVDLRRPVGRTTLARGGFTMSRIDNKYNNLQDGRAISANLGIEQALGLRSGMGLVALTDRTDLKDPGYSTQSWRLQWFGWRDAGRTTITATASIGRLKADERLSLFPERREDRYRSISLGAQFRQIVAQGMSPFVRLSWEENQSSVGIYDFTRRRIEFGVARSF